MCAVRSEPGGGAKPVISIARWVGRSRPGAAANDNLARTTHIEPAALLLVVCWRMTLGACWLGILAACACLFAVASPHP